MLELCLLWKDFNDLWNIIDSVYFFHRIKELEETKKCECFLLCECQLGGGDQTIM